MDAAPLKFYKLFYNGKPKPGSAVFTGNCIIRLLEAIKDMIQLFLFNPNACVAYLNPYPDRVVFASFTSLIRRFWVRIALTIYQNKTVALTMTNMIRKKSRR